MWSSHFLPLYRAGRWYPQVSLAASASFVLTSFVLPGWQTYLYSPWLIISSIYYIIHLMNCCTSLLPFHCGISFQHLPPFLIAWGHCHYHLLPFLLLPFHCSWRLVPRQDPLASLHRLYPNLFCLVFIWSHGNTMICLNCVSNSLEIVHLCILELIESRRRPRTVHPKVRIQSIACFDGGIQCLCLAHICSSMLQWVCCISNARSFIIFLEYWRWWSIASTDTSRNTLAFSHILTKRYSCDRTVPNL